MAFYLWSHEGILRLVPVLHANNRVLTYSRIHLIGILLIEISGSDEDFSWSLPKIPINRIQIKWIWLYWGIQF